MSEEGLCFCDNYIVESDEYIKLGYFYLGTPEIKKFDIWYRHATSGIVYNTTGNWSIFVGAIETLLNVGYINQNQYDCLYIQYRYLDGDDATRRLIRRLADVYDRTDSSNIFKMLKTVGEQIGEGQLLLLQSLNSHFISCATGESLNNIAKLLNLSRETGETDEQFRARILAKVPGYIGGGTIPAIKQAVSTFLGISEDDINVIDGYLDTGAYGHFRVSININVAPGVGQTYARLVELITEIKAAGTVLDSTGFSISEVVHTDESVSFTVLANFIPESQSASENTPANMFLHRADITYSDSLNVVQ